MGKGKIIFYFKDVDNGKYMIKSKTKGNIKNEYIFGLKRFVDEQIKKGTQNGKNRGR